MTVITWPVGIPETAIIDGYDEQLMPNVSEFKPDVGMPLLGRRTTEEAEDIKFQTVMTFTNYEDLRTWRRDTLKSGALPFQRAHPRKPTQTVTALFTSIGMPIIISATKCIVPMQMMCTTD